MPIVVVVFGVFTVFESATMWSTLLVTQNFTYIAVVMAFRGIFLQVAAVLFGVVTTLIARQFRRRPAVPIVSSVVGAAAILVIFDVVIGEIPAPIEIAAFFLTPAAIGVGVWMALRPAPAAVLAKPTVSLVVLLGGALLLICLPALVLAALASFDAVPI